MPSFPTDRSRALQSLEEESFDLLVVGGGITGCGVALDATVRGMRVALVEKDDFSSGTSSRSSKLIHGGLRYLRRLEVGLVRESLRERHRLGRMAPHLVLPLNFVIPRFGRFYGAIRAGLVAYDLLAAGSGYPRHRRIPPSRVAELAPTLRPSDGGISYWDARTDDARLVWTVARTAVERGATLANHAELTGIEHSGGRIGSAVIKDTLTGREIEVRARACVNAGGVWADEVLALEKGEDPVGIHPSKGIHVVLRASSLPTEAALVLSTRDKRFIFAVPWEDGTVVVGTTDDPYEGSLDEPGAEESEIEYLLEAVNVVSLYPVERSDVVAVFAGLRPLVGSGPSSKDISRRHLVRISKSGMVTITGGKLTTWRRMAAEATDAALEAGGFDYRPVSLTSKTSLSGASPSPADGVDQRLWHRYGSHAAEVLALAETDPELAEPLHAELPYLRAEAEYAIRHEMAVTADDVLSRRLRASITSSDAGESARPWIDKLLQGD